MSTVLADARKVVMNLPMEDRIILAHELLEGLEEEPISLEEMDRRLDEMRSGKAEMISLEDLEKSMHEAIHGNASAHP
ncbi:MAG: addiction module protein [Planctomycetia bacterium]|nr:addiction module protein [Planctomycetia bacterium]